jgi:aerobic-type carbon monoxide dehydrogenase small subunit (CoxS/CutS family)
VTEVELVVDGHRHVVSVPVEETLLETLRELDSPGARYCCGIGVCGTCTVLVDGAAVSSCLLLTVMVAGREITTAAGEATARTRDAFVHSGAFQCSYCIPAMALTVHAALAEDPARSAASVCEQLGGNLCRCGSYPQIREAVERLVEESS